MTISDLRSGLRRALATLAKLQFSSAGLPLSPTAELDFPEERLAARFVQRLSLKPPIDVESVAATLASVVVKDIPLDVDGLCIDLKVPGTRPKIWISKNIGRMRRRFTLAHEIGHIIIPWHSGIILDELDAPEAGDRTAYRRMEAEANRFAAELLMPSNWVKSLSIRAEHAAGVMRTIVQVADVSYPAALFRTEKLGPAGYVIAEVVEHIIIWSGRTTGTKSKVPPKGQNINELYMPTALEPQVVIGEQSQYYFWKMREDTVKLGDPSYPRRRILEKILGALPADHRLAGRNRTNAVFGYVLDRCPRDHSVDQMYQACLDACRDRSDRDQLLAAVITHPHFDEYLRALVIEKNANRQAGT